MSAPSQPDARRRVLLAFYFFPHYRGPILRALLASPAHDYTLAGDVKDEFDGAIATWRPEPGAKFERTRFLRLLGPVGWMRGTLRLALSKRFDTVVFHANPYLLSTWIGGLAARLTGKRVLFYTIGWFHHDPPLRALLKKVYYRIPHGLCLYGHWAKTCGMRHGFAADRQYVVYNALDTDRQRAVARSIDEPRRRAVHADLFDEPERPMIVCTSRLTAKRRLDLVLDAMAALARDGHPVNLLLVGAGPERERLEARARDEGLAVHFFGACYDEDVLGPMIAAADAMVAPGMVGLTAMHALVYGTPVITHDEPMHQSPEWEAIQPGVTGGFFERGDAADLAREIRAWTTGDRSPDATRARCRERIDRFYNPDSMRRAFDHAVGGAPADDLLVARGP